MEIQEANPFWRNGDAYHLGNESAKLFHPRLAHAFCPKALFDDNLDKFIVERAEMLAAEAKRLME